MYRTRGKPEDPWNKAAAQQEKDLADTIHVNQIRRNGNMQEVEKFAWSPTSRQKELTRLRNNFEQYKDTYQERLRKPNMRGKLLKELEGISESDSSYDRRNPIKRFVSGRLNDVRSNDDTTGCHKPAMLRAPLGTLKTIKVEVPARYKEAAIFCPQKSGGGESWSRKLKEIEKLQEKLCGYKEMTNEEGIQTDFVRELQDASIEVDLGNAQLEEINKILQATKSIPPNVEENSKQYYSKTGDNLLYNVQTPQEKLKKIQKQSKPTESLQNKDKLLLTLNNVNQRIQKLQVKFFKEKRPQYKSINARYRPNRVLRELDLLYKNDSYPNSPVNQDFTEKYPEQELNQDTFCTNEAGTQYETPHNRTPHKEQAPPTISKRSARESPRLIEIPPLEINTTSSYIEEYLIESSRSGKHSPTVFIDNPKTKMQQFNRLQQILEVTDEEEKEDFAMKSIFKPKIQETILKSDFLMKEFNLNPNDLLLNTSKVSQESNRSNTKNVYFSESTRSKLDRGRVSQNYEEARNSRRYVATNADYLLKNTLYSTVDE